MLEVMSVYYHALACDTLTPGMPPPGTGFIIGNMASAPLLEVSARAKIVSLSCYDLQEFL